MGTSNHVDVKIGPNGLKMYSVTTPLGPYFREEMAKSGVSESTLDDAAARGTLTHAWCASYARNMWRPWPPDDYKGYCESFALWFDRYNRKVLLCEEQLIDDSLGFFGTPDLCLIMTGSDEPTLVDLKTSTIKGKTWRLQVAAYKHLIERHLNVKVRNCLSLRLDRDGKMPKPDLYETSADDFSVFLQALNVYRYII